MEDDVTGLVSKYFVSQAVAGIPRMAGRTDTIQAMLVSAVEQVDILNLFFHRQMHLHYQLHFRIANMRLLTSLLYQLLFLSCFLTIITGTMGKDANESSGMQAIEGQVKEVKGKVPEMQRTK